MFLWRQLGCETNIKVGVVKLNPSVVGLGFNLRLNTGLLQFSAENLVRGKYRKLYGRP